MGRNSMRPTVAFNRPPRALLDRMLGCIEYPALSVDMPRTRLKSDFPSKICPVCQRPFEWRKKWKDCWDEVKYCSERCRRRRSEASSEPEGDRPQG